MRSALLVAGLGLFVAGCHFHHWGDGSGDGTAGPSATRPASGRVATESRPVGAFHGVSVSGACQVVAHRIGAESLEVTAEDDVLPFVQSEVRDGVLVLGLLPGLPVMPTRPVVVHVGARALDFIEASGASRVDADGIEADAFLVRASGASLLTVRGAVARLDAGLSGASRLVAEGLSSLAATGSLSGASYGRLRVRDRLDVDASGASLVEYFGSPQVFAQVSGSSVVRPLGD